MLNARQHELGGGSPSCVALENRKPLVVELPVECSNPGDVGKQMGRLQEVEERPRAGSQASLESGAACCCYALEVALEAAWPQLAGLEQMQRTAGEFWVSCRSSVPQDSHCELDSPWD